jgi:hypothetical protein
MDVCLTCEIARLTIQNDPAAFAALALLALKVEIGVIFDVCALCTEKRQLCESHIIPNAIFRRLKNRQSGGNLIKFNDAPGSKIIRSQESWYEHLLCEACETTIRNYECYGLAMLRAQGCDVTVVKHSEGVTFRGHSYRTFKLFLTSLVWRACVSKQETFLNVQMPPEISEATRLSLLNGRPLGPAKLGVRISRLTDKTGEEGALSDETLKQFIISPIARKPSNIGYSTLFVIEGFLLEFHIPSIPYKLLDTRGVHRESPTMFVPFLCISKVPEIIKLFDTTRDKQQLGLVTFKS